MITNPRVDLVLDYLTEHYGESQLMFNALGTINQSWFEGKTETVALLTSKYDNKGAYHEEVWGKMMGLLPGMVIIYQEGIGPTGYISQYDSENQVVVGSRFQFKTGLVSFILQPNVKRDFDPDQPANVVVMCDDKNYELPMEIRINTGSASQIQFMSQDRWDVTKNFLDKWLIDGTENQELISPI